MPKHFEITIQVEEVALGSVIRRLHNTPGIVNVDFDLGDPKYTNGADHPSKGKPKNTYEVTGSDFILKLLAKRSSMRSTALQEAFKKDGRAPVSVSSVLHKLRTQGLIVSGEGGYSLTKKMKDRLRHRKEG